MDVKEIPLSELVLLPLPADVCQECARDHHPALPHDNQSLYYQIKFHMAHGRGATWVDAMAHCTDEMKARWTRELKKLGIEVNANA